MPIDDEQKDGFLLNIWQAITLVGGVRERFDEIDPSELETVLTEAESLLIGAAMISGASPCLRLDESGAPRTSTARFPRLNPGRTESARPWYRNRSVSISRTARLLLLVLLTVLPMIALQAWHE